ncbi:enoyl-CoA hydratase/isomerase family protein [Alcaligenaceae bacterium]|nr:enoyl-CoA hydratase/isomerase family protein [Alcaligenaceae bacterium]
MSKYHHVLVDNQPSGVTVITMNRPEKRNALNHTLALELQQAFIEFDQDDTRMVAVLTGAGDDAFSAGADLHDFPTELWRGVLNVGAQTDKPVIAAVSGWCIGGALVMAMMADMIVASTSAKFYYPEAKVGFTGGLIAGLAARLPHHVAMEVILLCRILDAQRAHQLGFVTDVVPVGDQLKTAIAMAEELTTMAPLVHRTLKRFIYDEVVNRGPSETMARTLFDLRKLEASHDMKEGFAAFREKRAPVYLGK